MNIGIRRLNYHIVSANKPQPWIKPCMVGKRFSAVFNDVATYGEFYVKLTSITMAEKDPGALELSASGIAVDDPLMSLLNAVAFMYPKDPKAQEVAKFSFDVSLLDVFPLLFSNNCMILNQQIYAMYLLCTSTMHTYPG